MEEMSVCSWRHESHQILWAGNTTGESQHRTGVSARGKGLDRAEGGGLSPEKLWHTLGNESGEQGSLRQEKWCHRSLAELLRGHVGGE